VTRQRYRQPATRQRAQITGLPPTLDRRQEILTSLGVCATEGHAARRAPQLPVALLPPFGLLCSVFSVSSVVVLLVLLLLLRLRLRLRLRQRRTTEDTEDTETRQQGPSSKQRPGVAVPRVAVREQDRRASRDADA
jgi:hypothetical protein